MPLSERHKRRLVPLILILASFSLWRWVRESPRSAPVKASHRTAVNPITAMLRPSGTGERQEGVAAAILLDSSGSMAEKVRDGHGDLKPKIEIARGAVKDLLRDFERFAKAHPDRRIVAGVYEFSVRERQPSSRRLIGLGPPDLA